MKASQSAVEEAQSTTDFEAPPPGLYVLKLASLTPKFAQTNGKEDKSRPYVEARWQPVAVGTERLELPAAYSSVFDNVSMGEETEWKRAQYAVALGKKPMKGEFVLEEDPNKPGTDIGKECLGRIKKGQDLDGNYRPRLGTIFALNGNVSGDVTDAEAEDPFAEDEEEGGGSDYLTRAGLEAMEPKEIKPLLEQFDLDPSQFKGKTAIADAIDAILEAQGVGDNGGEDEGDEESPF